MVSGDLAVPAAVVAGGTVIDPPGGLDHHVAKALAVEPGAAQERFHDLVIEQIFEARLVAAALRAFSHGPLLTCDILCRIAVKHVRIVTRTRRFRGNSPIAPAKFALWWNRGRDCPFTRNRLGTASVPVACGRDARGPNRGGA